MEALKIEVKNVKFFEGHEMDGVNADLFINGVKVYHVHDDGNGGCLDFELISHDSKTKALAKLLNDFIDSIPEKPLDFGKGVVKDEHGNVRMGKTSLEDYVNDLIDNWQKAKGKKKMEKLFETCIAVGVPNASTYGVYNFKRKLSEIAPSILETKIRIIKMQLKKGEVILNTNLAELGVIL